MLAELHDRGHEIEVRTLASEIATMRGLGFSAAALAPAVEALTMDDWRASSRTGALIRSLKTLQARAPLEARHLQEVIAASQPDALIVDILAWGALAAAERWDGAWGCTCPFPLPIPTRSGPPAGPGLRPVRGALGRLRDRVVSRAMEDGFNRVAGAGIGRIRSELGLPRLQQAIEMYSRAPLHLYMSAEPFEYPRGDWPGSVVMVGPCEWEPPGRLPDALSQVTEPLVLVTTSSEFQDDGQLVAVAMQALAEEPVHIVATMPAGSPAGLEAPDNATVVPFVPHAPILRRSVCAITHGGMGATQKALALGVPACVVPFGRDQFEVARRVEACGAGSRLSPRRLRPKPLRRKVNEAIGRRDGAKRVARAFAAAGGGAAGADAIEQRLLA
ncbi:MAG TPA: nucleotide disphospho-sugar-binding domain-containing protein [Solirubrobacterales bacterium]|nr:nucleotide disphospho-sugar-binding domain-containing protein [Solirubrobacterales bacterium]